MSSPMEFIFLPSAARTPAGLTASRILKCLWFRLILARFGSRVVHRCHRGRKRSRCRLTDQNRAVAVWMTHSGKPGRNASGRGTLLRTEDHDTSIATCSDRGRWFRRIGRRQSSEERTCESNPDRPYQSPLVSTFALPGGDVRSGTQSNWFSDPGDSPKPEEHDGAPR